MAVTTMLVTGIWIDSLGAPCTGRIEFRCRDTHEANDGNLVGTITISVQLDADGAISIELVRSPSGYDVKEMIDRAIPYHYVLSDAAGPVDLSTVP